MIRQLAVFAVAAICLCGLTTAKSVDVIPKDEELAKYQKNIELLLAPFYLEVSPEIKTHAEKFTKESFLELYTNKEAVTEFWKLYEQGFLPPKHIFSTFEYEHLQQAIALFKLFYYAPDFDSFIQAASWARLHLNKELFAYSFGVATFHRSDTKYVLSPPIFKVAPNRSYNSDFILAFFENMLGFYQGHGDEKSLQEPIWANYTYTYVAGTRDPETSLAYLYEDVGFNTVYYFLHVLYPFWMSSKEFSVPENRASLEYSIHAWILKRVQMERYSFGLKPIEHIDFYKPIQTGYMPSMMHSNGIMFPQRKEWTNIPEHHFKYVEELLDYEKRIKEAIDSGHILGEDNKFMPINGTYEGFEAIWNAIQGNADSMNKNFYGSIERLSRKVLGFAPLRKNKNHVVSSAVESPTTCLRDPAFYRIHWRMSEWFKKMDEHTSPRTEAEVSSEFSIKSFEPDNVTTYFETFDTVLFNKSRPNHSPFFIKARQTRLNFKDFDYHFNVKADRITKLACKIFIGPEIHGEPTYYDMKKFYLVDYFVKDVTVGENIFTRNTKESTIGVFDFHTHPWVDYKKLDPKVGFGFPRNLLFPKGTCEGLLANFYTYCDEFDETVHAKRPVTFPLDRKLVTYVGYPNVAIKPALIYLKDESHINLTI